MPPRTCSKGCSVDGLVRSRVTHSSNANGLTRRKGWQRASGENSTTFPTPVGGRSRDDENEKVACHPSRGGTTNCAARARVPAIGCTAARRVSAHRAVSGSAASADGMVLAGTARPNSRVKIANGLLRWLIENPARIVVRYGSKRAVSDSGFPWKSAY